MSRDPCNIYIGRISDRVSISEVERLFARYGRVRDIHIKSDYGFVLFDDPRDADDAVYELNGYELDGRRLLVEHQRGRGARGGRDRSRSRSRDRYDRRGGSSSSGPSGRDRCYNCGKDGHWARDCKEGDWSNRCYACNERGHIERNCPNRGASSSRRSRSRSRSRSARRSRSRSRSRSPARNRSRSPAPARDRSRSRSRSRSPARDRSKSPVAAAAASTDSAAAATDDAS